jgi:hypothetical protein
MKTPFRLIKEGTSLSPSVWQLRWISWCKITLQPTN